MRRSAFIPAFLLCAIASRTATGAEQAPAAAQDLGSEVVVESYDFQSARNWKPQPGLFPVTRFLASDGSVIGPYAMAAAGNLEPGDGAIIGCVGGPYPASYHVEPIEFVRSGNTIRIVLEGTSDARPGDADGGRAPERLLYVRALLPPDLPDGRYAVECVIRHAGAVKDGQPPPRTLTCALEIPSPAPAEAKKHQESLKILSDDDLVRAYVDAGTALRGTALAPADRRVLGIALFQLEDVRYKRFQRVRQEILRRGAPAVPPLTALLQREVPRNATLDRDDGPSFGFARDVMELFAKVGDPRPVPLLVRVLDGFDGKANLPLRAAALDALEQITFVRFVKYLPHHGGYADSVEHPDAVPEESPPDPHARSKAFSAHAARYRRWLENEGKEPAEWLNGARRPAEQILSGDDLTAVYNTITFLQGAPGRDETPDRTAARVARVLAETRLAQFRPPHTYEYAYRGRPLPGAIGNLAEFLARYGPRARPHVDVLIRLADEMTEGSAWGRTEDVASVGGEKAMAWLVGKLPDAARRLHAAGLDPSTDWDDIPDEVSRSLLMQYQTLRYAVHRWAGRTFADDEGAIAWWRENKGKSQEQWLRDGLDATATAADGGDAESQYILRRLLPDLPRPEQDAPWTPPPGRLVGARRPQASPPFRTRWLAIYLPRLQYDADAGGFTLAPRVGVP